jgi:hypothetical protein
MPVFYLVAEGAIERIMHALLSRRVHTAHEEKLQSTMHPFVIN